MTQQPSQPARPTNPFASLPRVSGTNTPPQPQPAPAPQPPAPAPQAKPSGSLLSRVPSKTHWRTVAVRPYLVRFDLNGLGDPFYRLLGKKLHPGFGDLAATIKAIEGQAEGVPEIVERLELAWGDYALRGAVVLYSWRKDSGAALQGRIPVATENDAEELYDDDKPTPPTVWRALDFLLVLNVLARTRVNILLPDAPLALEAQYLNRSLFTDDPRLIALAQATGCIEDVSFK